LSDKKVGDFIGQHFISGFQQVGDFEALQIAGQLQKNGGNVVGYFCTVRGEVIHAVVGAVAADKLLAEARWAVDTYHTAKKATRSQDRQLGRVQDAHLSALGIEPRQFHATVQRALPSAYRQLPYELQRVQSERRQGYESLATPPVIQARRQAVRSLQRYQNQVHEILAAWPMADLGIVYRLIFDEVANQRVVSLRGHVQQAAKSLALAQERTRPILYVLFEGSRDGRGAHRYDDTYTYRRVDALLKHREVAQPLGPTTVVKLRSDQLSALSQLGQLPTYRVESRTFPIFIVANCQGEQRAVLQGAIQPRELAEALWPTVNECNLKTAEEYLRKGRRTAAETYLRRIVTSPGREAVEARARALLQGDDLALRD
jgi:hypothetical protein